MNRSPISSDGENSDADIEELTRSILAKLDGVRVRPATGARSRLRLAVAVAATMLLPISYFGIVALFAAAPVFYAFYVYIPALEQAPLLAGFLLFPPIPAIAAVVFLLRPFFLRIPPQRRMRTLPRERAPEFYAIVEKICGAIGSPRPSEIRVNLTIDAGCHFTTGPFLPRRRGTVMYFGLSLVGNMTIDQFCGVVAHEAGHHARAAELRAVELLLYFNHWFARRVRYRDPLEAHLDTRIDEKGRVRPRRYNLFFVFMRMGVASTRWLLRRFLTIGNVIGSGHLQQLEYYSDACAVDLAGSATVCDTLLLISWMHKNAPFVQSAIDGAFAFRELPDDYVELFTLQLAPPSDAVWTSILDSMKSEKARPYNTHPRSFDRILRAKESAAPGIHFSNLPASRLIRNFKELSLETTLESYKSRMGIAFKSQYLRKPAVVRDRANAVGRAARALGQYLQMEGAIPVSFDLTPRPADHAVAVDEQIVNIRLRRESASETAKASTSAYAAYRAAVTSAASFEMARLYVAHGISLVKINGGAFGKPKEFEGRNQQSKAALAEAEAKLAAAASPIATRIRGITQFILACPDTPPETRDALAVALQQYYNICDAPELNNSLAWHHQVMSQLIKSKVKVRRNTHAMRAAIKEEAESIVKLMREVFITLDKHPYPFGHGDGDISLSKALMRQVPFGRANAIYVKVTEFLARIAIHRLRILGTIVNICDEEERRILNL